jgi:hypothetical protein
LATQSQDQIQNSLAAIIAARRQNTTLRIQRPQHQKDARTMTLSTAINTSIEPSLAVVQELLASAQQFQGKISNLYALLDQTQKVNAYINATLVTATLDGNPSNASIYLGHIEAFEKTLSTTRDHLALVMQEAVKSWAICIEAHDRVKTAITTTPGLQLLPPTFEAVSLYKEVVEAYVSIFDVCQEQLDQRD